MKKITVLLIAMIAVAFAMEISAGPVKAPNRARRSEIYNNPRGFQQLGDSKIYYDIDERQFASADGDLFGNPPAGPGPQTAISILGRIDDENGNAWYYPCTFGDDAWDDGCGSGFLAALKVVRGNNSASDFVNSATGTTIYGVTMTARIEAAGEQAALITYTLYNSNDQAVTVSAGVYADVMIGINDYAPLYGLRNDDGKVYGIKMIDDPNDENSALFCALFGEGVTDVEPADDYWFGEFGHNYSAEQIVGNEYSDLIWDRLIFADVYDQHYMQEGLEGGAYDSGMGFCWKNRRIEGKGTIEFSYIISVGDYDMSTPIGDDRLEYTVEAFDFEGWNDLSVAHPAHVFGYYEHPYGQHGYIEYQVDGMRSWTRIPTELVSGQEFDLPFDMFFNADVTTTHTLELRFTDGLDNITPMDGLSWTDVRSIPINGLEDRVYNGQPQIFEVTIGDGEPFTIGENGEYTDPGTYTFGFEGDFDENTIGIHNEDFNITAGETVLNVVIPEDCVYDGNEHAATATLLVGDGQITITYVNTKTGEGSENAPVEPGTYEVFVEVTGSQNFNDLPSKSYGTFTIDKAQSEITYTVPEDCVYDGEAHAATAQLVAGDGVLTITYVNTETGDESENAPVEPGTYNVVVTVTETAHYYGLEETVGTFTIDKAQSRIIYSELQDVNYDGKPHGADVTLVEGDGDLIVIYEDTATGARSLTPPTEEGNYDVYVIVTETDRYYGIEETKIGNFSIIKKHTGINELNVDAQNDGAWYTIDGRRVAAPTQTGIYIHNGKKYYVK